MQWLNEHVIPGGETFFKKNYCISSRKNLVTYHDNFVARKYFIPEKQKKNNLEVAVKIQNRNTLTCTPH